MDERRIGLMKPGSYLINIARSPIVDEGALYNALKTGKLAGAALDVWYRYPNSPSDVMPSNLPFHELPNVLMTPHISAWTEGTINARARFIAENIMRVSRGEPPVNAVARQNVPAVAAQHQNSGPWQKSITRDDRNGRVDFTNARLSLLWQPSSSFKALATVNRWIDQSDFIAPQATRLNPAVPPTISQTGIENYPFGLRSNRYADWNTDLGKHNRFFSASLRVDYDVTSAVTLTSLSTYIDYKQRFSAEFDGVPVLSNDLLYRGDANTVAQEIRAAGKFDRLNVVLGGNYQRDYTSENVHQDISATTVSYVFTDGMGSRWQTTGLRSRPILTSFAFFGNAEYEVVPGLTIQGGVRYTKSDLDYEGCTADAGDGNAATVYTPFINSFRTAAGLPPMPPIPPGGCLTFNPTTIEPELVMRGLKQDNISWRAGVQFAPSRDTLLYANVSKGYKAGGVSLFTATVSTALTPVSQESVLGYEAGFKQGFLNDKIQLNGAAFYYDYKDKQVAGNVVVPVIGKTIILVNVPKSRIYGAELQLSANPTAGFTVSASGSYIKSRVSDFFSTNAYGVERNFDGTELPNVPRWQLNGMARYEFAIGNTSKFFLSGNASYQSRVYNSLGEIRELSSPGYVLVDGSLGVEGGDGRWRASVWGRNIFNKNYVVTSLVATDTITRYMGMPATYGLTLSYKY